MVGCVAVRHVIDWYRLVSVADSTSIRTGDRDWYLGGKSAGQPLLDHATYNIRDMACSMLTDVGLAVPSTVAAVCATSFVGRAGNWVA